MDRFIIYQTHEPRDLDHFRACGIDTDPLPSLPRYVPYIKDFTVPDTITEEVKEEFEEAQRHKGVTSQKHEEEVDTVDEE